MGYRIGFASISGEVVDEHFGSARYWQIYDVDDLTGGEFVESRKTDARCKGHCEGGFEHLLTVLNDCDALVVSRIGESAAAVMIANGKRVFEAEGEIEDLIFYLTEQNLLEEG